MMSARPNGFGKCPVGKERRGAFRFGHRCDRSADLDVILARAGVTKGAFYYHFDSKEALGYAVVNEVITSIMREKWVRPLQNANNPIDTLARIVQSTSLKPEDLQRGCPLNNLSQEMSPLHAEFRKTTAKVFRDWHDANRGCIAGRTETWGGAE